MLDTVIKIVEVLAKAISAVTGLGKLVLEIKEKHQKSNRPDHG